MTWQQCASFADADGQCGIYISHSVHNSGCWCFKDGFSCSAESQGGYVGVYTKVPAPCDTFDCSGGSINRLNKGAGMYCTGDVASCDAATCCAGQATCDTFDCSSQFTETINKGIGVYCVRDAATCDAATCCEPPLTMHELEQAETALVLNLLLSEEGSIAEHRTSQFEAFATRLSAGDARDEMILVSNGGIAVEIPVSLVDQMGGKAVLQVSDLSKASSWEQETLNDVEGMLSVNVYNSSGAKQSVNMQNDSSLLTLPVKRSIADSCRYFD